MKTAHQNAPTPQSGPDVANKDFVDASIAAAPAAGNVFVFRPGGVAADNVYTSFSLLYADLVGLEGQRVLEFDSSLGACTVPAGTYAMHDVEWSGRVHGLGQTLVTIANGVTLTGLRKFSNLLVTTANGATTPCADYTAGAHYIYAYQTKFRTGVGSSPLFLFAGTSIVGFDMNESGFENTTLTDEPLQLAGSSAVTIALREDSYLNANVLISALGTALNINVYSGAASYDESQPANLSALFSFSNKVIASGSIVGQVISGAGRSTHASTIPRIVGSFAFNPLDHVVNLVPPVLAFRALAANGTPALTNSVQLYNLTDAAVVTTLSFTSTSTVKQVAALTIGGGAGQIPNSEKVYEIRIFMGADPGGDPLRTIELYSANMTAVNVLS